VVGDLGYKERYARMVEELLRVRRIGIPVVSLTDLFASCPETVYSDWSHLAREDVTGESLGYRMMATRMATELATAWGLRRRDEPAAADEETAPARVACTPSHTGGREETLAVALAGAARGGRVAVSVRGGVRDAVGLVHLLGTAAYRVVHANAAAARGRGVPYVLTPFWEDWARWRVAAEAWAQAFRVRLGLPPTVDLEAYTGSVEAELRER